MTVGDLQIFPFVSSATVDYGIFRILSVRRRSKSVNTTCQIATALSTSVSRDPPDARRRSRVGKTDRKPQTRSSCKPAFDRYNRTNALRPIHANKWRAFCVPWRSMNADETTDSTSLRTTLTGSLPALPVDTHLSRGAMRGGKLELRRRLLRRFRRDPETINCAPTSSHRGHSLDGHWAPVPGCDQPLFDVTLTTVGRRPHSTALYVSGGYVRGCRPIRAERDGESKRKTVVRKRARKQFDSHKTTPLWHVRFAQLHPTDYPDDYGSGTTAPSAPPRDRRAHSHPSPRHRLFFPTLSPTHGIPSGFAPTRPALPTLPQEKASPRPLVAPRRVTAATRSLKIAAGMSGRKVAVVATAVPRHLTPPPPLFRRGFPPPPPLPLFLCARWPRHSKEESTLTGHRTFISIPNGTVEKRTIAPTRLGRFSELQKLHTAKFHDRTSPRHSYA